MHREWTVAFVVDAYEEFEGSETRIRLDLDCNFLIALVECFVLIQLVS